MLTYLKNLMRFEQIRIAKKLHYGLFRPLRAFVVFVLFIFYLGVHPVWGSVLGDLATAMKAGTFVQITGSQGYNRKGVTGGIWSPVEFGCGDADTTIQYAAKAAYDPTRDQIRFMGQTHGTCTGG